MSTQAYFISGDSKFYLKAGTTSGLFLKKINLVDPTITGTQTVNGDQRVNGNLYLSNLDVNNIDYALFSGLNVLIKSGDIVSDSNIFAKNLVYNTGNQTISGVKTFATQVTAPNLVYNSGYQVINGSKTFNDSITFLSGVTFVKNAGAANADADIDLFSRFPLNTRVSIGDDTGILGQSINTLNIEREIKIWETGGYITAVSYGPYIRIGRSGVLISEKTESKVGIGTLFPREKLHISGGNLRVDGNVSGNNLSYTGDRLVYINMNNNSDTMNAGINYFGQLAVGYKSFAGGRAFQILQDLIIKKATWTHICGVLPVGTPNNTNGLSSGFVVISSNAAFTSPTFALISENISPSGDTNAATNFSKEFNPPLKIHSGNYIVAALTAPLWTGVPTNQPGTTRNSLNLYCYY